MSNDCVSLQAIEFGDIRLLWIFAEMIRIGGIAFRFGHDMPIPLAISLSDGDQENALWPGISLGDDGAVAAWNHLPVDVDCVSSGHNGFTFLAGRVNVGEASSETDCERRGPVGDCLNFIEG
jgi:hypothetical protein